LTPTNSEAIGLGLTPNSPDMQSLWSFGAVALPAQSQAAMLGTGTLAAASPNAPSGGAATAAMLNSFSAPHSALTPQTRTPEALAAQALLATAEDAAFSIQNLVLGAAQPTATEVSDEAMALQLRLSVQPSTLTTRLMNMKATELTQAWSQLMTPVTAPPKGEAQELMLEIGEELMASLEAHTLALDTPSEATSPTLANPLSGEVSGKSAQASSTVAPGNAPATLGQQFRNDQIQQLADKMGQAMADRLQQQIAKGEWSLQLRMNPAQLGQVDVTLDMSAAGLDAVFNADNAMTRELIALGSQKLKDSLTQSGTTVANVYINGDGGRQSGGNSTGQPTPQHPRAQARSAPDATIAAPRAAEARIMRSDGWDALA
jgi:flagellar hook-length control protein FliK